LAVAEGPGGSGESFDMGQDLSGLSAIDREYYLMQRKEQLKKIQ
jgi:hypothetical protein